MLIDNFTTDKIDGDFYCRYLGILYLGTHSELVWEEIGSSFNSLDGI